MVPLGLSTGISSNSAVAEGVTLYPNPASTSATLELSGVNTDRTSVQISDVSGRMVKDFGIQQLGSGVNTIQLDLSNLAAGSYRLQLNSAGALSTLPLQVVR